MNAVIEHNDTHPVGKISPTALACSPEVESRTGCFHCGTLCRDGDFQQGGKSFCCVGCRTVFEILTENGLDGFYSLAKTSGVRAAGTRGQDHYLFLDAPEVCGRLADYVDERTVRATLHLPAIHCIACVWLLENLFHLKPGIGRTEVNFPRKELALSFDPSKVKFSEVAALLATLGYEPELKLSDLEEGARTPVSRRLWLQLGVAGFAFGNIMLFSIASYLGMDAFTGPGFRRLTGALSLLLALPVVAYSAADYWSAAWVSLSRRLLTIDVPIAAGIAAIFGQSVFEVSTSRGEGYFDSLCGLIFFLLCGRLFQKKTFDRLSFERDYKSFFPISVTRRQGAKEETVALESLNLGDRLIIRNGELIPADSRLLSGLGLIDYSFVTGEAEPTARGEGELIYAGGRQIGGAIEVEIRKAVSQGYLTSLWNQEAFRKDRVASLDSLTNLYSYRFTKIVMCIALGAALFWALVDPTLTVKSFTSVLIVACPCALALAAPFTLGTAIRVLGRGRVFVKNAQVIETLARVDAVVFDKTGTLTAAGARSLEFEGLALTAQESEAVRALTSQSTHPNSVQISRALNSAEVMTEVRSFRETTGCGIEGVVDGKAYHLGSTAWFESLGLLAGTARSQADGGHGGSVVRLAVDGRRRGTFVLAGSVRPETERLITGLSPNCQLALLSGDNERERAEFEALFGGRAQLHFNQSPVSKLEFVEGLQREGRTVLMAGDGLNDAGALRQSDVGVAVVESISAFSPASDIILSADQIGRLPEILTFSRQAVRVVRWSFVISSLYNVVGIAIAASGHLAPIVCAILMPLSSISVVVFACGATTWFGRRAGLAPVGGNPSASLQPGSFTMQGISTLKESTP